MRNLLELLSLSPEFFFKKLMKAHRDEEAPRKYHASVRSWNEIKTTPFLYLAHHEELSLTLLAHELQAPGETITFNMYEVEYPLEATHDDHVLFYEGVWNPRKRRELEMYLHQRQAIMIAYHLVPEVEETLCLVMRTPFVRVVSTTEFQITMLKQPEVGEQIPGSSVYRTDPEDFSRSFDINIVSTTPAEETMV